MLRYEWHTVLLDCWGSESDLAVEFNVANAVSRTKFYLCVGMVGSGPK